MTFLSFIKFFICIFILSSNVLSGAEDLSPMVSLGGGYLDAGSNHSGGILQVEYKAGNYLWKRLRPQVTLLIPQASAFYIGLGMGWDWKLTERVTLTPSFEPGFYFKGKCRNLGFPVEFRSCIELSYRLDRSLIGFQAYHLSNASLGNKNPGMNAYTFFFAFPI